MMSFLLAVENVQKMTVLLLLAMLHYHSAQMMSAPSSQESPKKHLQHEAVSRLQSPAGFSGDKQSDTRNVVVTQFDQKQLNPNIADQYKDPSSRKPVSQAVNLTKLQHKGKKPANQSPSEKYPQRVIGPEDKAMLLGSEKNDVMTNNLIQPKLEEDGLQYSEKKNPLGRTPSSVRKMISAFESGLAQDMDLSYQRSTTEKKDSSKTQHLEQDQPLNTKPAGFLQEREKDASLVRNLQQVEEKNDKDLIRATTFETVTVSGKMPERYSDIPRNHPSKLFGSKQGWGNASEGSYELCVQSDSPQKQNSVVHFINNNYSFESSGVWIFPDEPRKICVTTSGKSVMSIMDSQDTEHLSHQRSLDFSKIEHMEKNAAYVGIGTEGNKYEKIQEIEESKAKTSDDNGDENSGGPFNQVIKVAIVVGFGILVLLTRQRKRRMKEKNA